MQLALLLSFQNFMNRNGIVKSMIRHIDMWIDISADKCLIQNYSDNIKRLMKSQDIDLDSEPVRL